MGLKSMPGDSTTSPAALFGGSTVAAAVELAAFFPFDTAVKRVMTHQGRLLTAGGALSERLVNVRHVVLQGSSLWAGMQYAILYKVLQRGVTFGCQPILYDSVSSRWSGAARERLGEKNGRTFLYGLCGGLMGLVELVLLPFDTLKIIKQTSPHSIQGRGMLQIISEEKWKLYRGGTWTAARNFIGSLALFGGSALAKEYLFLMGDYRRASTLQDTIASTLGAVLCLIVSSPFDVIKARLQRGSITGDRTGRQVLNELLRVEGPMGLFKGLNTKTMVVAPKLVVSFTVCQQATKVFDGMLGGQSSQERLG